MDAESPPPKNSSANLSDLVKEMVKEMDANEFYSKTDFYDDSAEVMVKIFRDPVVCWTDCCVLFIHTNLLLSTKDCRRPLAAGHQPSARRLDTRRLFSAYVGQMAILAANFAFLVCYRKQNARTNRVSIYCLLTCVEA